MENISNLDLIKKVEKIEHELAEKEILIFNLKSTCRDFKEEIDFLRKLILKYIEVQENKK